MIRMTSKTKLVIAALNKMMEQRPDGSYRYRDQNMDDKSAAKAISGIMPVTTKSLAVIRLRYIGAIDVAKTKAMRERRAEMKTGTIVPEQVTFDMTFTAPASESAAPPPTDPVPALLRELISAVREQTAEVNARLSRIEAKLGMPGGTVSPAVVDQRWGSPFPTGLAAE